MFLLRILGLLLVSDLRCECVRGPWIEGRLSHFKPVSGIRLPSFVCSGTYSLSRLKNATPFHSLKEIPHTPQVKLRPSTLFSTSKDLSQGESQNKNYRDLIEAKNRLSKFRTKVSFLVSLVSFSGYLIPFMIATESFGNLLLSLDLPKFLDDLVRNSIKTYRLISSIPNLMDVILLLINKVFIRGNDLNLSHFIKFNFSQGNILFLYTNLLGHLYSDFIAALGDSLLGTFVGYTMVLSAFTPLLYCMGCSLLGVYSQLPLISQAAELTVASHKLFKV